VVPGGAGNTNATAPAADPNIAPIAFPYLGFVNNPGGNDPKAVALSFDDGPDGVGKPEGRAGKTNMSRVLDQLEAANVKATFFLCGGLFTNVHTDALAQADIKRMLAAGHHIGSHTFSHITLDAKTMSLAQAANEFTQNETAFEDPKAIGPSLLPFTMYRTPFGKPFQNGIVYPPTATSIVPEIAGIAPSTPPNAVHVGWGIDSKDWDCVDKKQDSSCIMNNLETFFKKGASGVILLHAIHKLTADTMPQILASIKSHGYHIVMVEDFIKAKYGATSAEIARANAKATFDAETLTNAAIAATKTSKWYLQTNEN
jgi:peptidoglycan/xylan/chitin deacetylase (PgdA/CDA1 family)